MARYPLGFDRGRHRLSPRVRIVLALATPSEAPGLITVAHPVNGMAEDDPHGEIDVVRAGADTKDATGAVVALHGRGATANGMLDLVAQADRTGGALAHLAPQASRRTWYPASFLEDQSVNEPHLSSALQAVKDLVETAIEAVGREQVIFLGFSQGACLACEFIARTGGRFGGVYAFSGGLIGSSVEPDRYAGSVDGTAVYLGCSDVDPHIPVERVNETAAVFEAMDAEVTTSIFPGMGHTVNPEELEALADGLNQLA